MAEQPLVVQSEHPVGELSRLGLVQHLPIDLHAAVDHINVAQQFGLGALGQHGGAELRLAVMGQDHVLQQHGALLGHTAGGADAAEGETTEEGDAAEETIEIEEEQEKQLNFETRREFYHSDTYIEQVAREQLGMVKPNEIIYINRSE